MSKETPEHERKSCYIGILSAGEEAGREKFAVGLYSEDDERAEPGNSCHVHGFEEALETALRYAIRDPNFTSFRESGLGTRRSDIINYLNRISGH